MTYYEKNKEKFKESNKKFKEQHPDYWQEYYENNKEKILSTAEKWRENNKGDYIYFYVDTDGNILYIGSTGGRPFIERSSFHLNAHSNLKMTAEELVEKYNLSIIVYKDFTKYKLNREDLFFIENFYKENFKEILGKAKVVFKEDKLSRSKEELIEIAEKTQYLEFNKLERYLG